MKDKEFHNYFKVAFWLVLVVTSLSLLSYLLNPYFSLIKEFKVGMIHIYLFLILITLPLASYIKRIKWGDKEFELFDKKEIKNISELGSESNRSLLSSKIKYKLDEYLSERNYLEGIIYFVDQIGKNLRDKLEEKTKNFLDDALKSKIINEYQYYDIRRLITIRNYLVHQIGLGLSEIELINILYLAASLLDQVRRMKK